MTAEAPVSIAILADDLTGAADCAVAFGRSGLSASVEIDGAVARRPGVTAYSSDTRDRDEASAVVRVEVLTREIVEAGFERLYKKIDSLVRGHVAAELSAVLAVLDGPVAIVTPAFPSHGRRVLGGMLTSPTRSIDLLDLLAPGFADRLAHVGLDELDASRLPERIAAVAPGGALVCDSAEDADLERLVDAVEKSGRPVLYVGSAGLAAPLGARWARGGSKPPDAPRARRDLSRVAVVVGSATDLSRRQVAGLLASHPRVEWFELSPDALIGARSAPATVLVSALTTALRSGRIPVLSISAALTGAKVAGRELADGLGELLRHAGELHGLVITGGETARAVLERLGVPAFVVLGEVEPGVVHGRAERPVSLELVLKSGGFGDEATLVRCVEALHP